MYGLIELLNYDDPQSKLAYYLIDTLRKNLK